MWPHTDVFGIQSTIMWFNLSSVIADQVLAVQTFYPWTSRLKGKTWPRGWGKGKESAAPGLE